jgi:hypothetical protein
MDLTFESFNRFIEYISSDIYYEKGLRIEKFEEHREYMLYWLEEFKKEVRHCILNLEDERKREFYFHTLTKGIEDSVFIYTLVRPKLPFRISKRWSKVDAENISLFKYCKDVDFADYSFESLTGFVPHEVVDSLFYYVSKEASDFIDAQKKFFKLPEPEEPAKENKPLLKWNGDLEELAEVFYILAKKGKINLREVRENKNMPSLCRMIGNLFDLSEVSKSDNPAKSLNSNYLYKLKPEHLEPGKVNFDEVHYVFGKRHESGFDEIDKVLD